MVRRYKCVWSVAMPQIKNYNWTLRNYLWCQRSASVRKHAPDPIFLYKFNEILCSWSQLNDECVINDSCVAVCDARIKMGEFCHFSHFDAVFWPSHRFLRGMRYRLMSWDFLSIEGLQFYGMSTFWDKNKKNQFLSDFQNQFRKVSGHFWNLIWASKFIRTMNEHWKYIYMHVYIYIYTYTFLYQFLS